MTSPELSLFLFGLDLGEYTPLIEAADASGFSVVWIGDHVIVPSISASANPYSAAGHAGLDPRTPVADVWTTIAHAARSTSRVKLATGVYILPLRDVFVTARSAASVQALSDGRFLFGIGTGWLREEFEALGQPFDDRGERADELLDALAQLWRGEPIAYTGKHVSFGQVQFSPPAIPIPIIVGGTSKGALQRAAAHGDGWFAPSGSLEAAIRIRDAIDTQRKVLERHGQFTYYVRPEGDVNDEVLERYTDAGFTNVTISLKQLAVSPGSSLAERVAAVERAGTRFGLTGGS